MPKNRQEKKISQTLKFENIFLILYLGFMVARIAATAPFTIEVLLSMMCVDSINLIVGYAIIAKAKVISR